MSATTHTGRDTAATTPHTGETVLLEWTLHLALTEPVRAAVAGGAVLVAAALGWAEFRSPLFGLAGGLLVLSAVAEYLFPVRYRITTRGVQAAYGLARLEMEWHRVRRVDVLAARGSAGCARLSPFTAPCGLDAIRGIVLRFAPDGSSGSRSEVVALLTASAPQARLRIERAGRAGGAQ